MRAKVMRCFRDRLTGRIVYEGETVEISEKRARELASKKIVQHPHPRAKPSEKEG